MSAEKAAENLTVDEMKEMRTIVLRTLARDIGVTHVQKADSFRAEGSAHRRDLEVPQRKVSS